MDISRIIYTKDENCKGCNKCIFVCPSRANEAYYYAEEGKVYVKSDFCISCGECLKICDHKARDYFDDEKEFFADIDDARPPIVIIAPSARFSFNDTGKLISYLRSLGVPHVFDVSFGADICTWAHVKAMNELGLKGIIAQPCPVVVNYIEKYQPELIEHLSPIQSPAACLAIYLKKYLKMTDKIAFLSPCIAKTVEFNDENTHGIIDYNITFKSFLREIEANHIDIDALDQSDFDGVPGALGFVFSRPGGLSENVKHYCGDELWIKQLEGISKIKEYLQEYADDIQALRPIPDIIDVLNCEHGCNLGTGTEKRTSFNEIDRITNEKKRELNARLEQTPATDLDLQLSLADFYRSYDNKSSGCKTENDVIDVESAFMMLGKLLPEDRTINCFACGYGSCLEFAMELAAGHNDKRNCKDYLLNKYKRLSYLDDLTGVKNRFSHSEKLKTLKSEHPGFVGVMYVDINGLKEANDLQGHKHGDHLIISCVRVIEKVFPGDIYRVGGDEFFVMDSASTESEFINKTLRLKELFSIQNIVAVSIGSAHSYTADDLEKTIEVADKLMYENKQYYYRHIANSDRRKK